MNYAVTITCFLLFFCSSLLGNSRTVDFAGKRAERVSSKKVERKLWGGREASALQEKSFPIEEWSKHYSSLGAKRAPIAVKDEDKMKRFEVEIVDRKVFSTELSDWNERLFELHRRAGIQLDDQAQIAADRQLYSMALQDSQQYEELGKSLSLRDINRFQFRSNRPDGDIPKQKAGEGQ